MALMVGVSPVITQNDSGAAPPPPPPDEHYMFDWTWDDTIIYLGILF